MTVLIYIGGYGRSGSTLLESLLTTRSDVIACGEVICCLRKRRDRGCTCGKSRRDCAVWQHIYRAPNGPRGLNHVALTLALLDRAQGRFGFLVDSSKTAWGALGAPFKLRRMLGDRFRLVHVVRDPRGVCWSNAGGTKRRGGMVQFPLLTHFKTAVGWTAANLSCEFFRLAYPNQYRRVRYEDLVRSYESILEELFAEDPEPRRPTGILDGNRHQLFGNHNRYKDFAPAEIRPDMRWKTTMPRIQQSLVAVLTGPLRRLYGY